MFLLTFKGVLISKNCLFCLIEIFIKFKKPRFDTLLVIFSPQNSAFHKMSNPPQLLNFSDPSLRTADGRTLSMDEKTQRENMSKVLLSGSKVYISTILVNFRISDFSIYWIVRDAWN